MSEPTDRQRVNILFFYGAVFLLGWLFFRIIEPFLVEIAWAAVLGICFEPAHAVLARRFGPSRAALLSTLIVTALIVIPGLFVASALVAEGSHAASDVQSAFAREGGTTRLREAWDWARARAPFLPPVDEVLARVTESMGSLAANVAARAGGVLKNVASFFFSLVITLFVMFFFLRDGAAVRRVIDRTLPFPPSQRRRLIDQTEELVSASVIATLVIAVIQGFVGGLAFAVLGLRSPVVWGVVMGIASFIPLVGTALVWLPAALLLLVSGEIVRGIILVVVGALISNVDNVVRPLLLSGKSEMNGLLVFISLLGGVSAFGFIGIVLGPLVAATVVALLESYTEVEPPPEGPPPSPPQPDAPTSEPTPNTPTSATS